MYPLMANDKGVDKPSVPFDQIDFMTDHKVGIKFPWQLEVL